jgi:F-type H+-transporting ATPase subunit delta
MASLRLIASTARRTPSVITLARRGYAEVSDKIKLSLVLPHQVRRVLATDVLVSDPVAGTGNLHLCRCRSSQSLSC